MSGEFTLEIPLHILELYEELSEEDRERVKALLETLLEVVVYTLSTKHTAEFKPRQELTQQSIQTQRQTQLKGNLITRLYTEAMSKLNIPPGTRISCEELKKQLILAGYSEYTLELFTEKELVIVEDNTCTTT